MGTIQADPGIGLLQHAIDQAKPGDIVELLPGRHRTKTPLQIHQGGTPGQPIVIRGRAGAIIDGEKSPDPADLSPPPPPAGHARPELKDWSFFKMTGVVHVEFENLEIEGCWPVAIFAQDSRHLALRRSVVRGATFPFFVRDDPASRTRCTHFLVEENEWTQDTSADHKLWQEYSWIEAHGNEGGNGTLRFFSGGLFGSRDLGGNVIFRRNRVYDAYNGVVFWASPEIQRPENRSVLTERNVNLFVYDNEFTRVRDNPIEPEGHARNLHIRHNRFANCHAWISLESVRGGYWYIYGNLGHFTEKQGGGNHTVGKVLKFSENDTVPTKPVYVFNNSWYLRCPVIPGEPDAPMKTRHLRFFNNAIQYCQANDPAGGICNPAVPIFENVDWSEADLLFDHDLSNNAQFLPVTQSHNQEPHGRDDPPPYFRAAPTGNFRLTEDSPAKGHACAVEVELPGGPRATVARPSDIGAFQGERLISAPELERQESTFTS